MHVFIFESVTVDFDSFILKFLSALCGHGIILDVRAFFEPEFAFESSMVSLITI